jgi:hypothetical protein
VHHGLSAEDAAYLEVRLVVQLATGTAGDEAEVLIRRTGRLLQFIELAKRKPPPETTGNSKRYL